jgi:hypothetical protein
VKTADAKRCPSTPAPSNFPESVTSNHTSEAYYAVCLIGVMRHSFIAIRRNSFDIIFFSSTSRAA